jgi:leucyl/phenylalanyl-tRNA---protein transferase
MPVFELPDDIIFPDPSLAEPDGLLALGGDLSQERLLLAYASGIFPWYSEGEPILWWSPDPRLVLIPGRFRISRSLRQKIRRQDFEVKWDTAFTKVLDHCAGGERAATEGTWLTKEMKAAYTRLHRSGYAHSVETYFEGELAGGLYGVSLGRAFFGESMFHLRTDASKIALYHLVMKARESRFLFIDSQVETGHMVSLGAERIPRGQYLKMLEKALEYPTQKGKWKPDQHKSL